MNQNVFGGQAPKTVFESSVAKYCIHHCPHLQCDIYDQNDRLSPKLGKVKECENYHSFLVESARFFPYLLRVIPD